jgi:hypothetical protein
MERKLRKTTSKEDEDFIKEMLSSTLLELAGEYIAENFPPEDVYTENQLRDWALDNGFVERENA